MTDHANLVRRVAAATDRCEFTVWGYGVGPALTGLVRAGRELGRPELVDGVVRRVAPALGSREDDPAVPGAPRPEPTDHLIPVETLLALPVDTGAAVEAFRRAVLEAVRPVTGRPRVHRPDLERWRSTVWVDCMHTDGPGLALLGELDAAVALTRDACRALQREDGLFDHGYDVASGNGNGVAWGRGQGWALLGLTGVLRHRHDDELAERLARQVAALASYEEDGRWHTVVDRADAPIELSTSAYVALAVGEGVETGAVDPAYKELAERALQAAVDETVDGVLPVSDATPVGAAEEDYFHRPAGLHPWGQGPLLLALLDRKVNG